MTGRDCLGTQSKVHQAKYPLIYIYIYMISHKQTHRQGQTDRQTHTPTVHTQLTLTQLPLHPEGSTNRQQDPGMSVLPAIQVSTMGNEGWETSLTSLNSPFFSGQGRLGIGTSSHIPIPSFCTAEKNQTNRQPFSHSSDNRT